MHESDGVRSPLMMKIRYYIHERVCVLRNTTLSNRKSSLITTFLLPQGKFRYLRAPMGLNASSYEWGCKSDIIVEGLPWARKLVDDTIIWADNEEDLVIRTRTVLERCKENNITISRKKFEMGNKIEFAGHIISDTGIRPDEKKFAAIKQFPTPSCIKDVRAFLGLANELGSFIPDLAHMTSALTPLLKKGTTWNWLPEHQAAFQKIKDILTSDKVIQPLDPNLDTILLTDASRLHGIGFALIQLKQGNMRLIQCASSSLTPTHQRYAVCELECMAVQWAIKKSDFYLRGLPHFEIWTDHKPLVGIFSKGLNDLDNPRLMRFREKIMFYNFSVKWVPGKTHYIADSLSFSPVFSAAELDEDPRDIEDSIHCLRISSEPALNIITEAAEDNAYAKAAAELLQTGKHASPTESSPLHEYSSVLNTLSIAEPEKGRLLLMKDSAKIVIPKPVRSKIIAELHRAYSGINKTYSARQLDSYTTGHT